MGLLKKIAKGTVVFLDEVLSGSGDSPVSEPENVRPSGRHDDPAKRGNELKRSALAGMGVNVEALTEERVIEDARSISTRMCGLKVRSDKRPTQVGIEWENLTSTGRVPKKVAQGNVVFDWKNGDSVICHVWYLASAEAYAADVYSWHDGKCHSFTVRTEGGEMALRHEAHLDPETGFREVIY